MDVQKGFVLVLVSVFLLFAGLMLSPFTGYLLGALVLAFVLYPGHQWLKDYVGENVSAFVLTLLSILVFLLPFAIIISTISGDASGVIRDISQTEAIDIDGIESMVEEITGSDVDIRGQIKDSADSFISTVLGGISQALSVAASVGIGISIMLFLVFYLLKDGKNFKDYLKDLMPLPSDIVDDLYEETYLTTWAVIKGHVLVALAQGLIAGIGIWFVGVPNAFFWTFVMVLLSFIPIIGSFLVWGPAGLYMVINGDIQSGLFLLVYGAIVVNLTDNFLRPFVVDKEADLHPMIILIGVIGGVYVFGAAGLFIGPVVFGTLKAVLEVFNDSYSDL